ncbi:advillin-like [Gigantopelta aegis]|uniref:advillin-like n=1 Tax=Gigantopelta aegis TaxID=1735272 RepID=UPI001B889AD5|nr:advillin-like [Gigantopelta aegis]
MSAFVDEAFVGVGQEVGLVIWRIEKLKVVVQDKSTHGEFFSGDSYIVLNTKKAPRSSKLEWDVHFWLGSSTSQDEKGVAAYKTVELDDYLGGAPVQHREVQEHESKLFQSYFKCIKYLEGGVDSGFKKVERDKYETRLLHVKGKRNIRVKQVKCHYTSLNQGDVFVLDAGLQIFVWCGPASSKWEQVKGGEVARSINDEERGGRATVTTIDTKWDSDRKFFQALGSEGQIAAADVGGDDREFERISQEQVKLFRVSDDSGVLEVNEVSGKPLNREHLESEDCFILDSGPSGIYVWVGKKCTKNEKKSAWQNAIDFLSLRGYPEWTPVTSLVEGAETPLFKQYFSSWVNPNAQVGLGTPVKTERVAKYSDEKFDANELHRRTNIKKENLPDDGNGEKRIWRIEDRDMIPVKQDSYGIFYGGDCYIIQYTYMVNNKEHYIVYYWQGTKSTTDEIAASAILAQRLDDHVLHGMATQIRVTQGREPEHFLRMFQGTMVILMGGINNKIIESDSKLYHIRGTNAVNTRAIEVPARAASLNSNDVFVVDSSEGVFFWIGKGASDEEKRVARNLQEILCPDKPATEIYEGTEPTQFWAVLGGQEPYATGKRLEVEENDMPSRLFQCSNASGRFLVEEIVDFSQEDLVEDDVMLLDTFDEIFVWVGKGANEIEKKESLTTAMEYLKTDPAGRSVDTTLIMQVKQGFEPPNFTGHFHAWDPERWSHGKSYEEIKKEHADENVGVTSVQEELSYYNKTYSYEELRQKLPPKGVDATCKEKYLSDEEFEKVFNMTKSEFYKKPKWKQIQMRKKTGLF